MTRTDARTEFLTDVYTTALEGGINAWSTCTAYARLTTQRAVITDIDDDQYVITLDTIDQGVTAIITGTAEIATDYWHRINAASITNDAAELDADHADAIVQAGLYGRIIWE